MITEFDRTNLRALRTDIETALASVATKHGIVLTYKSANYLPNNVNIKIEGATIGAGSVVNSSERDAFKYDAYLYCLKAEDLDKEITYAGEQFIITGLNRRRTRFPIVAKQVSTGRTRCLTAEGVRAALLRQTAVNVNPPVALMPVPSV